MTINIVTQFNDRRPSLLAHLTPYSKSGEILYAKPNVNGSNGVDVYDADEFNRVVGSKAAHEYDYDSGKMVPAKVHEWHSHATKTAYPAGGTIRDERSTR